jgi:hypothetical protein
MDHRPFEDWLLENKELTSTERRQLDAHLQCCHSCTALAEVNLALRSTRLAAPTRGFTDRFQMRLAARKQALRVRNLWGFLILGLSAFSLLIWLSWPVLISFFQSPVNMVVSWLTSLMSTWAAIQTMFHAGETVFKVLPSFVPEYVWAAVILTAVASVAIWVISLRKITKVTRGVQ